MAGRSSDPGVLRGVEERTINEGRLARSVDDIERTSAALGKETKELTKSGPSSLNVFLQGDSKVIKKKTLDMEMSEAATGSTKVSSFEERIAHEINQEIVVIQSAAVLAVAKSLQVTTERTTEPAQSSLDIETTRSNVSESTTSSGTAVRDSFAECQLDAQLVVGEAVEEANKVIASGRRLLGSIEEQVNVIQTHITTFLEKARDAGGVRINEEDDEDGDDFERANYYHTLASKYEASVEVLKKKGRKLEVAVNRVEESAGKALRSVAVADEVTDEDLQNDVKFVTTWCTSEVEAACIVSFKKQHAALTTMKRILLNIKGDVGAQDESRHSDSSNQTNQKCENKGRKTKIAHVVGMFIGVAVLGITPLFKVDSNSFRAILCLGILITAWTVGYWCLKLYRYIQTCRTQTVVEERDPFLHNINKRLAMAENYLRKRNIDPSSDSESDAGSWATTRMDDISQHS